MFNVQAFLIEAVNLPDFRKLTQKAGGVSMSIAAQLDSAVDGIFILREVKGYPVKDIVHLLKKHGLEGINGGNFSQWWGSREKTQPLIEDARKRFQAGELQAYAKEGVESKESTDPFDSTQLERERQEIQRKAREEAENLASEKALAERKAREEQLRQARERDQARIRPEEDTEEPKKAKVHAYQSPPASTPGRGETKVSVAMDSLGFAKRDAVTKAAIEASGDQVITWQEFLDVCHKVYGKKTKSISDELVERGIIEDGMLVRKVHFFPDLEPQTKIKWKEVMVKRELAETLFGD